MAIDKLEMNFPSPEDYLGSGKSAEEAFADYADAIRRFADRLDAAQDAMSKHCDEDMEVQILGTAPIIVISGQRDLIEDIVAADMGICECPICVDACAGPGDPDEQEPDDCD